MTRHYLNKITEMVLVIQLIKSQKKENIMQISGTAFLTIHSHPQWQVSHSPFVTQQGKIAGNVFESFGSDFQRQSTLPGISPERVTRSMDIAMPRGVNALINVDPPFEPIPQEPPLRPHFPNFPPKLPVPLTPFQGCRPPRDEGDPTKWQVNASVDKVVINNDGSMTITVGPSGYVKR